MDFLRPKSKNESTLEINVFLEMNVYFYLISGSALVHEKALQLVRQVLRRLKMPQETRSGILIRKMDVRRLRFVLFIAIIFARKSITMRKIDAFGCYNVL